MINRTIILNKTENMKNFVVEITETLQRRVVIVAENANEAQQQARAKYDNADIVLDNDNFTEVCINVVEEKNTPKCPHCGKELNPSVVNNYLWCCEDCDEDFCDCEVID
jgi:tRNA(Ile2) C34 agmatinyltransferase TiaS